MLTDLDYEDTVKFMHDKSLEYDDVIAMGGDSEKTKLLLPYVGTSVMREVPDPYYGGEDGFDDVITLINDAVSQLATMLG